MARSSIYRTLTNRVPKSDVHCVERHSIGPEIGEHEPAATPPEEDWSSRRRATPAEHLLPATLSWLASLPLSIQPAATRDAFPRVANTLSLLWHRPDALREYLDELLIDKRGGRRGFPLAVLEELHALNDYHATLRRSPRLQRVPPR